MIIVARIIVIHDIISIISFFFIWLLMYGKYCNVKYLIERFIMYNSCLYREA